MQKVATRALLGLSIIIASLAMARTASAGRRLRNAVTNNGIFYLSVAGGIQCTRPCWLNPGTDLIVWHGFSQDQFWQVPDPPGLHLLYNDYTDSMGGSLCIGENDNSPNEGAYLVTSECSLNDRWYVVAAEDLQAPFSGCVVIVKSSWEAVGVEGGVVKNGSHVMQWPFFFGTPWQLTGWHPDQFWCPE